MSPLVITDHEKILVWPDEPVELNPYNERFTVFDNLGDEHEVILQDDGSEMVFVFVRHAKSGKTSANFCLEFNLQAPEGFPPRLPQITSAFVGNDYRRVKLSQHVYRMLMKHYGAVVSDTHQTPGGMMIWLLMGLDDAVQLNILQIRNDRLEFRIKNGEPETYIGDIDALEQAGDTIWGDPNTVINSEAIERIGFTPAHRTMEQIVLAARAV